MISLEIKLVIAFALKSFVLRQLISKLYLQETLHNYSHCQLRFRRTEINIVILEIDIALNMTSLTFI